MEVKRTGGRGTSFSRGTSSRVDYVREDSVGTKFQLVKTYPEGYCRRDQ